MDINKYYEKQLMRLSGQVQVQFKSDLGDTNWMNLNADSFDAIKKIIPELAQHNRIVLSIQPKEA